MKNLLIILFLVVSNSLFAQKYIQLIPEIAPDSAGCGGEARGILHGGVPPYQTVSWWSGSSELSATLQAENICEGIHNTLTIFDSNCSNLFSEIVLFSDTTLQVYLDTVIITMPSGPGMCDGMVQVIFENIDSNYLVQFALQNGPQPYTGPQDSTHTYSGLCEGRYYCAVSINSENVYYVSIDLFLNPTTYFTCVPFDVEVLMDSPSSSSSCDGRFDFNPIIGPVGGYYYSVAGIFNGYSTTVVSNSSSNFVDNICRGAYAIYVENASSNIQKIYRVFLDTNGVNQIPWNLPDSLLPDTDTILLNAIYNCALNYNEAIDSAYITSYSDLGNGEYEFDIIIIQDTSTIVIHSNAVMDTSLNFFVDITTFCVDSTRTTDPYWNERFMIYHGVQLQSTQSINENNFLSSFKIYPNPSEDIFQIDFETKESSILNFELTDITGKIIHIINYSSTIGKNQLNLNLDQFACGLYLLNVRNEQGFLQSKKLIKN